MAGTSDEKKIVGISFLGKKMYVPIVEIAFPWSVYLLHCSIQNNAGGDETTFSIAVIHHQNSSKTKIVPHWSLALLLSQLALLAVPNTQSPPPPPHITISISTFLQCQSGPLLNWPTCRRQTLAATMMCLERMHKRRAIFWLQQRRAKNAQNRWLTMSFFSTSMNCLRWKQLCRAGMSIAAALKYWRRTMEFEQLLWSIWLGLKGRQTWSGYYYFGLVPVCWRNEKWSHTSLVLPVVRWNLVRAHGGCPRCSTSS